MKRVLMVAKEYDWLLKQVAMGAATKVGADAYEHVKAHLRAKGVHVTDQHMSVHDVPADRAYWHN